MYLESIIPMITYSTIYLAIEEREGMDGSGVHWMTHSINRTLIHLSAFRGGENIIGIWLLWFCPRCCWPFFLATDYVYMI